MIALGCLMPIALPALFASLGYMIAGTRGSFWGCIASLAGGFGSGVVTVWIIAKLKQDCR
jgi:hypothetical protein